MSDTNNYLEPDLPKSYSDLLAEEPSDVEDALGGHMNHAIRSTLAITDRVVKHSTYLSVDLYFSPRIKQLKTGLMSKIASHVGPLMGNYEQESSEFSRPISFYNKRDFGEADEDYAEEFTVPVDWKSCYDEPAVGILDYYLWNDVYSEELEERTRQQAARVQSSVYLQFPNVGKDEFAIDYTIFTIPNKKRRVFQVAELFKKSE